MNITEELTRLSDMKYKAFHSKLIPNINPDTIIGVRTPHLRALAKKLRDESEEFLGVLPHDYYEENNLHGFIISEIKDFDKCIEMLDRFLPYVDNWATCDGIRPKCFAKNKDKLLLKIKEWIASDRVYTVRFALEMLMCFYLDEDFRREYLGMAAAVDSGEYYVNMMLAWYFATALAKQWDESLPYITEHRLPVWVHNKTIQKAVESLRITKEQKEYLKTLKINA